MRFLSFLILAAVARADAPAPSSSYLLKPSRVFDGESMHDGWAVVVVGDKIESAGPAAGLKAPEGRPHCDRSTAHDHATVTVSGLCRVRPNNPNHLWDRIHQHVVGDLQWDPANPDLCQRNSTHSYPKLDRVGDCGNVRCGCHESWQQLGIRDLHGR